ncbi:hypothetical protein DM01DRAFT_1050967 [Hesseltinella vesiculosa]|uniref:Uncharacterized protein n=1 Tax=Hesseltinella vesiculosa TaxID=101127 RepID=A0A1X2GG95_9FUNG|nr:hypothetical protein DM01DRAFT_1050967 [Hesseltinella vesiculosa]
MVAFLALYVFVWAALRHDLCGKVMDGAVLVARRLPVLVARCLLGLSSGVLRLSWHVAVVAAFVAVLVVSKAYDLVLVCLSAAVWLCLALLVATIALVWFSKFLLSLVVNVICCLAATQQPAHTTPPPAFAPPPITAPPTAITAPATTAPAALDEADYALRVAAWNANAHLAGIRFALGRVAATLRVEAAERAAIQRIEANMRAAALRANAAPANPVSAPAFAAPAKSMPAAPAKSVSAAPAPVALAVPGFALALPPAAAATTGYWTPSPWDIEDGEGDTPPTRRVASADILATRDIKPLRRRCK